MQWDTAAAQQEVLIRFWCMTIPPSAHSGSHLPLHKGVGAEEDGGTVEEREAFLCCFAATPHPSAALTPSPMGKALGCGGRRWVRRSGDRFGTGDLPLRERRVFALSVRNQRFLTALPKGEPRRFARCTQQGKEKSPDFSIEALVFALPIFTARGSEPRAASGRTSKANEWQRSKFRERIASRKFRAPQQDTCRQKKAPTFRSRLLVFALPIFTARVTILCR